MQTRMRGGPPGDWKIELNAPPPPFPPPLPLLPGLEGAVGGPVSAVAVVLNVEVVNEDMDEDMAGVRMRGWG